MDMKKILFVAALLSATFAGYAQGKVIRFAGVPVCGDRDGFVRDVRTAGFRVTSRGADGTVFLVGVYNGVRDSAVSVEAAGDGGVSLVSVNTPPQLTWEDAETVYGNFKARLVAEYGEPEFFDEFFPEGIVKDSDRKRSVVSGQGRYESVFHADDGRVILKVAGKGRKGVVVAVFFSPELKTADVDGDGLVERLPERTVMPEVSL